MKTMVLAKTFGVVLALAAASLPTLVATSGSALARGDSGGGGNGGGGGGADGGGGGGGEGGNGGGSLLVPPARGDNPPPRTQGGQVIYLNDRDPKDCQTYRRGMYSYYGYPLPYRCQPYRQRYMGF